MMKYASIKSLVKFVDKIDEYINSTENQYKVSYPKSLISRWKENKLIEKNNKLLSEISNSASIYAIFVASKGSSNYEIKYIGKTKKKYARTRLTNHLIKKHEKTGAKLVEVKKHAKAGDSIKVAWVEVEPESLRNYVEEELIEKYKGSSLWNRESKKPSK